MLFRSVQPPRVTSCSCNPTNFIISNTDQYCQNQHRRAFLQTAAKNILRLTTITATTSIAAFATAETDDIEIDNDVIRITLNDPSMKLGLELSNRSDKSSVSSPTAADTTKSTTTTNTIVYVQRIVSPSSRNANIREGMILLQYNNAKTVQETLLQPESYPIT